MDSDTMTGSPPPGRSRRRRGSSGSLRSRPPTPLEDVPVPIVEPERVRLEAPDRRGGDVAVVHLLGELPFDREVVA